MEKQMEDGTIRQSSLRASSGNPGTLDAAGLLAPQRHNAKSTDPEKIIKVWEGDTYQYVVGRIIKMRACDHKAIQGFRVGEYVPPAEQKVSYNISTIGIKMHQMSDHPGKYRPPKFYQ